MSGFAAAQALRAVAQTRAVPIALYSAHDEDEVGSQSADYDVFLKKPIEAVTLGLILDKLIRTGASKLRAPRAR